MAWTTPTTRSTGDLITAAIWNTDLVDDLNYLYGSLPSARVYHNATQTVADVTTAALALNTERWDNDVIHDTSTNNSRLTCKTAGKYIITATGEHESATYAGTLLWIIRLNGATFLCKEEQWDQGSISRKSSSSINAIYDLAINDYIEFVVTNNSGGTRTIQAAGAYTPEFGMHRIGG